MQRNIIESMDLEHTATTQRIGNLVSENKSVTEAVQYCLQKPPPVWGEKLKLFGNEL